MAAVGRWGVGGWERARCAACAAPGAHPGAALFAVPNSKATARSALSFDSAAAKSCLRQKSTTPASACMRADGAARRSAHSIEGGKHASLTNVKNGGPTCVFWVGSICGLRPFRFDVRARRRSGACAWRWRRPPPAAANGGKRPRSCGAAARKSGKLPRARTVQSDAQLARGKCGAATQRRQTIAALRRDISLFLNES